MKIPVDKNDLTGIVLAGGKSGRIGMDKGLMEWNGRMLVQYSIEALRPFCRQILISTNNEEYARFGFPLVEDKYPHIGPLGGLHASLSVSGSRHHMVLACDMPLVDHEIIRLLLAGSDNFQAVVPVVNKRLIPVCGYYHSSVLPVLEKEIGAGLYKSALFLQRLRVNELLITNPVLQNKFFNVNSIEDFKELAALSPDIAK